MKVKEDSKKGKSRKANPYGQSSHPRKTKKRMSDSSRKSEELADEEDGQTNYHPQDHDNDNEYQGNSEKTNQ